MAARENREGDHLTIKIPSGGSFSRVCAPLRRARPHERSAPRNSPLPWWDARINWLTSLPHCIIHPPLRERLAHATWLRPVMKNAMRMNAPTHIQPALFALNAVVCAAGCGGRWEALSSKCSISEPLPSLCSGGVFVSGLRGASDFRKRGEIQFCRWWRERLLRSL